MENYVITIARGFGSGGKDIGNRLGKKLGIPCYEEQILDMAAEYSGINKQLFTDVDEKLKGSYLRKLLTGYPVHGIVEPSDRKFVSDNNLFNIQSEIIQHLAASESCIIIGKCADYVLRKRPNVISVYIEAPRQACLGSIMQKMQISYADANDLIKKTDKYRADYYRYYTQGGDWTNPVNYDLTLNSDRVGRDACVSLLEEYVKIKLPAVMG